MAKKVSQNSTDAALNYDINAVERMVICSAEPTDYTNVSTVALGDIAIGAGDFTLQTGGGGRQYVVAQKTDVNIDTTGTANHIALVDDTGSELLTVTTTPNTEVSSGGTATINSWTRTIADPS